MALLILSSCQSNTATPTVKQSKSILTIVPSPKGNYTENFNPFIDPQISMHGTQGFLYETLLFYNRYDASITPWLASSYNLTTNPPRLTFHLRPGVKWSDGQPLTSQDVLFTLQLLQRFPKLDLQSVWSKLLKSASAPDPSTVVLELSHPSATALWNIGGQIFIVPQHLWKQVADPTTYPNTHPVGTGPFVLTSWTPRLLVYNKQQHYWQPGLPKVDEIREPALDTNTSADFLLGMGQLDWAGIQYTPDLDPVYLNADAAHNHVWLPPNDPVVLYLNDTVFPFNQLAVRQAMSLIIDRHQLMEKADPYAPPASPTALILPANRQFLAPQYTNLSYTVNTAQANKLLQQAGFHKDATGKYIGPDGKKISFHIDEVDGWNDWVTDCQIIAQELQAQGIDATVKTMSFTTYYKDLQMGAFDASVSWATPGPTPYYLYASMLDSKTSAAVGSPAASNFERWMDPETDKLLQQYASSSDPVVQQQALNGLQKIMVEQLPTIPLTYNPYWDEYKTTRFVGWPDAQHPYVAPSPTTFPDIEYVVLHLRPVA